MAWFSKPKKPEPIAPECCARCRERLGTVLVRFVADPEAPPLEAEGRAVWLCNACRGEGRRAAGDN